MARLAPASDEPAPASEMVRLHKAGLNLIPLGAGEDGKSPLLKFAEKPKLTLSQLFGPMRGKSSGCYGVRLENLAVLDCDIDDLALVANLEKRFGLSKVHVKTPRGWHLYYEFYSSGNSNLRSEGLPVDIKKGANSYAVGPHSVRPDGSTYLPHKGVLGKTKLSELKLSTEQIQNSEVAVGGRNRMLFTKAIQMVEYADTLDELVHNLIFIRDEECACPETVLNAEIIKIANWAWKCRLENRVYLGRQSEFRIDRQALDRLKNIPNESDTIALYVKLHDLHGHKHAFRFALKYESLRQAKHTDLSRERFQRAKQALINQGLLQVASTYKVGSQPKTYRLTRTFQSDLRIVALSNGGESL